MYVTHKMFSDASSKFWDSTKTGNFLWAMNLGGIECDLPYNEDMCAPLSTVLSACSLSLRVCHKADSSACPSTMFVINRAIPFIGFRAEYYYKSQPVRQWLAHGNQPVRRSQWSENSAIKEAGSRERCSWKVCNHMEHRASPTAIYNAGTPQKKHLRVFPYAEKHHQDAARAPRRIDRRATSTIAHAGSILHPWLSLSLLTGRCTASPDSPPRLDAYSTPSSELNTFCTLSNPDVHTRTLALLPRIPSSCTSRSGVGPIRARLSKKFYKQAARLSKDDSFPFQHPNSQNFLDNKPTPSLTPNNKMLSLTLTLLLPLILPTTAQTPTTSYLPQPSLTPQNPNCTTPTGFSNRVVTLPSPLATPSFEVAPTFASAHLLFLFDSLNGLFSRAAVGTFCLEQCIAYQGPPPSTASGANGTTAKARGDKCLSFNVNLGKPIPAEPEEGDAERWFCSGFDAYLSAEVVEKREVEGSFLYPVAVNRVCGGTYRDY